MEKEFIDKRRIYGRRMTRPPGPERQSVLDGLLSKLGVPAEKLTGKADLSPASLYNKKYNEYWLEIGFGNGEHLAALMERHPDTGFMGAEPFINGMAAFTWSIRDVPHNHVRVWMEDAMILAASLTPASLDGIYVLNPDPWPKKRHHKRRIISQENLNHLTRILKPGGKLIMATDVDSLAEWMVTQCMNHPALEWTAEKAADWQTPPEGWIETRYQKKGANKGRKQTYLIFIKKA